MTKSKGSKIWFILFMCFLLYFAVTFINQQRLFYARQNELDELNEKIAQEEKTSRELKELMQIVGSDEYVEKIAREELGLIKENERIFIDIND